MIISIHKSHNTLSYRILSAFIAFTFIFSLVLPPGYAQLVPQALLNLPSPGTMVTPSAAFTPALINGITIHPENPLEFDFIVGTGDENLQGKAFEEESTKLIKYFLASLTVPENEMWVNLSPYEKDRIIPQGFGTTEMGRDLLAQDYILKQLTASLMYPENELGRKFWDRIYKKAREQYGTTEIPLDTFNKVWIMPDKAVVYEHEGSVFVIESHLKVMLEQDYLAMNQGTGDRGQGTEKLNPEIIREIILPEIEKEVNTGETFANLRQIYNSMILATWYKKNLRESLLGQVYVDKSKTKGVDLKDPAVNQKIYEQYLEAFKKGVYNYIKEDVDPVTKEVVPRKYFSGGAVGFKESNLTTLYSLPQKQQVEIVKAFREIGNSPDSRFRNLKIKLYEIAQANRISEEVMTEIVQGIENTTADEAQELFVGATSSSPVVEKLLREYWEAGENQPLLLQDIVEKTGLDKRFVLSALETINNNPDMPFRVEPAGLHKKLDKETLWIRLVARRPLGELRPRSSQRGGALGSSPVERIEEINSLLERIDKEIERPESGNLPEIMVTSDYHGEIKIFLTYIADAISRKIGRTVTLDAKQFPQKTIERQLKDQGVDIKEVGIAFYILGDFLDRGAYGIKVFKAAEELVNLGIARYVTGNHDFWAFLNLMGFHLPVYEGYNFYGHTQSKELVAQHWNDADIAGDRIGWWTQRLAEYNLAQKKLQEEIFSGRLKEIREDFKKTYAGLKDQLTQEEKELWEDLIGFYFGTTDVYTGFNGVGLMSAQWWEEKSSKVKVYAQAARETEGTYEINVAQALKRQTLEKFEEYAAEAVRIVRERLAHALGEGKWWWQVFNDINHQNYTSVEWWGKDWSSHEGWGTTVIDELNELAGEKTWNQANYIRNPYLQELAAFYRKHFTLYLKDPYGNTYTHGWLPVDKETGKIPFTYGGITYDGNWIWDGLEAIQDDVRDLGKPLPELYEALNLVNSWYADKTTEIKPEHIAYNIEQLGLKKIYDANGIGKIWFTGHNPQNKLAPLGGGFKVQQGDYVLITTDKGMSWKKFGDLGEYVSVNAKGIQQRGYAMPDFREIVDNPPVMSVKKGKGEGAGYEVTKSWANEPLSAGDFLNIAGKQLKEERKRLEASSPATTGAQGEEDIRPVRGAAEPSEEETKTPAGSPITLTVEIAKNPKTGKDVVLKEPFWREGIHMLLPFSLPREELLIAIGGGGIGATVALVNSEGERIIRGIKVMDMGVWAMDVSKGGELAVGGSAGILQIYDIPFIKANPHSGRGQLAEIPISNEEVKIEQINAIRFLGDNQQYMAVGYEAQEGYANGIVILERKGNWRIVERFADYNGQHNVLDSSGDIFAYGAKDGVVVRKIGTWEKVTTLELEDEKGSLITALRFSAKGNQLSAGTNKGMVKFWYAGTTGDFGTLTWDRYTTGEIRSLDFSPDDKYLLITSGAHMDLSKTPDIMVIDIGSPLLHGFGHVSAKIKGHNDNVYTGRWISEDVFITAGGYFDKDCKFWKIKKESTALSDKVRDIAELTVSLAMKSGGEIQYNFMIYPQGVAESERRTTPGIISVLDDGGAASLFNGKLSPLIKNLYDSYPYKWKDAKDGERLLFFTYEQFADIKIRVQGGNYSKVVSEVAEKLAEAIFKEGKNTLVSEDINPTRGTSLPVGDIYALFGELNKVGANDNDTRLAKFVNYLRAMLDDHRTSVKMAKELTAGQRDRLKTINNFLLERYIGQRYLTSGTALNFVYYWYQFVPLEDGDKIKYIGERTEYDSWERTSHDYNVLGVPKSLLDSTPQDLGNAIEAWLVDSHKDRKNEIYRSWTAEEIIEAIEGKPFPSSPMRLNHPTDRRLPDEKSAKTGKELTAKLLKAQEEGTLPWDMPGRDGFIFTEILLRERPGVIVAAINEFERKMPDEDISQATGEALIRWLYQRGVLAYMEGSEVKPASSPVEAELSRFDKQYDRASDLIRTTPGTFQDFDDARNFNMLLQGVDLEDQVDFANALEDFKRMYNFYAEHLEWNVGGVRTEYLQQTAIPSFRRNIKVFDHLLNKYKAKEDFAQRLTLLREELNALLLNAHSLHEAIFRSPKGDNFESAMSEKYSLRFWYSEEINPNGEIGYNNLNLRDAEEKVRLEHTDVYLREPLPGDVGISQTLYAIVDRVEEDLDRRDPNIQGMRPEDRVAIIKEEVQKAVDSLKKGSVSSPVKGLHFKPELRFRQDQPLSKEEIAALRRRFTRTNEQVRALLQSAQERGDMLSITGHLRGADIAGSSLDLPEFQSALTEKGAHDLDQLPSTIAIASEFTTTVEFGLAANPDQNIYVAEDYGFTQEAPYVFEDEVMLENGRTPTGQLDGINYIMRNVFGLSGVKITVASISPMALAGGMESSNVFNVALIAAASMLTGANLSQAEIFNLAVKIENNEFGGKTGGQGHLAGFTGGIYRQIWLSGVKDGSGNSVNPYSAMAVPLLNEDQFSLLEKHMFLVQAGKEYRNGKAVVHRTAALVNDMWTDLLKDNDKIGFALHQEKLSLTARSTQAVINGNFLMIAENAMRYVEIRDVLAKRWLELMLGAQQGKKDVPAYAHEYARKVFDKNHPEYAIYKIVRDIYAAEGEAGVRRSRLYSMDPIASLIESAQAEGIAIMPLGAGGPGANLIAIDPQGIEHLETFLRERGLSAINEEDARALIRGKRNGVLKGYMPFRVGKNPMQFNGFKEIGLTVPQLPAEQILTEDAAGIPASSPVGEEDLEEIKRLFREQILAWHAEDRREGKSLETFSWEGLKTYLTMDSEAAAMGKRFSKLEEIFEEKQKRWPTNRELEDFLSVLSKEEGEAGEAAKLFLVSAVMNDFIDDAAVKFIKGFFKGPVSSPAGEKTIQEWKTIFLTHSRPMERIFAAHMLGELLNGKKGKDGLSQDIVRTLIDRFKKEKDPGVRLGIVLALGKIGGEEAATALRDVMVADERDFVRDAARDSFIGLSEAKDSGPETVQSDVAPPPAETNKTILVLDPRSDREGTIKDLINEGYAAVGISTAGEVLEKVKEGSTKIPLVIVEINAFSGAEGEKDFGEFLEALRKESPLTKVIVYTHADHIIIKDLRNDFRDIRFINKKAGSRQLLESVTEVIPTKAEGPPASLPMIGEGRGARDRDLADLAPAENAVARAAQALRGSEKHLLTAETRDTDSLVVVEEGKAREMLGIVEKYPTIDDVETDKGPRRGVIVWKEDRNNPNPVPIDFDIDRRVPLYSDFEPYRDAKKVADALGLEVLVGEATWGGGFMEVPYYFMIALAPRPRWIRKIIGDEQSLLKETRTQVREFLLDQINRAREENNEPSSSPVRQIDSNLARSRQDQRDLGGWEKSDLTDSGMSAPGGIDLNPALLDLQIKRDGNGVPLPLPMQPIENMHIEGFLPIIINITPVTNLPMLLGLADAAAETQAITATPDFKTREVEPVSLLN